MKLSKLGAGNSRQAHVSEQVDGQAVKKAVSTAGNIVKLKL